ncbi:MAG: hypothetical protein LH616_02155 [Ilumatobacteraceae bacterium]|nr:hypothetical protein [Ilumatobacteraceae bacterium]
MSAKKVLPKGRRYTEQQKERAVRLARLDEAVDHRHEKCASAAGGFDGHEPAEIAVGGETCEIENQFDNPTTGEDLAVFLGLVDLVHLSVCSQPCIKAQLMIGIPAASGHCIPHI